MGRRHDEGCGFPECDCGGPRKESAGGERATLLFVLFFFLVFVGMCALVSAQVRPPQPDYAAYGSYSRQMTVYENAKRREDALDIERYRKFREEVKRQTVVPQYTVIVSSREPTCYQQQQGCYRNRYGR